MINNIPLIILGISLVILLFYFIYDQYEFFNEKLKEGEPCCSDGKGCMCTNPKYYPLVCEQDRAIKGVYEGIIVDARCYAISKLNYTNDHAYPNENKRVAKNCGTACAKKGVPVGLLVGPTPPNSSSQVYVLLHPAPNLAIHMEKPCRVTGCLMKDMNAIFTTKVEVKEKDGSYHEVNFTTPMSEMGKKLKK